MSTPSLPSPPAGHHAVAWANGAVIRWMRERVVASGGDPADIPDEPAALLRLGEVIKRTGYSRPTLYKLMAAGKFPKPIRLSEGPSRAA